MDLVLSCHVFSLKKRLCLCLTYIPVLLSESPSSSNAAVFPPHTAHVISLMRHSVMDLLLVTSVGLRNWTAVYRAYWLRAQALESNRPEFEFWFFCLITCVCLYNKFKNFRLVSSVRNGHHSCHHPPNLTS